MLHASCFMLYEAIVAKIIEFVKTPLSGVKIITLDYETRFKGSSVIQSKNI